MHGAASAGSTWSAGRSRTLARSTRAAVEDRASALNACSGCACSRSGALRDGYHRGGVDRTRAGLRHDDPAHWCGGRSRCGCGSSFRGFNRLRRRRSCGCRNHGRSRCCGGGRCGDGYRRLGHNGSSWWRSGGNSRARFGGGGSRRYRCGGGWMRNRTRGGLGYDGASGRLGGNSRSRWRRGGHNRRGRARLWDDFARRGLGSLGLRRLGCDYGLRLCSSACHSGLGGCCGGGLGHDGRGRGRRGGLPLFFLLNGLQHIAGLGDL